MITVHRDDLHALAFLSRHDIHPDRKAFAGLVFVKDGEIIGAAGLDASLGGEGSFDHRHEAAVHVAGRGCWSRRTLATWFAWAFGEMGFKRLAAQAACGNAASIRFAERLGFIREGVRRGAAPDGSDVLMFGLLATDQRRV